MLGLSSTAVCLVGLSILVLGPAVSKAGTIATTSVDQPDGEQVFQSSCAACHGSEGEGGGGPPLQSSAVIKDAVAFVQKILHGGGYMPPLGADLSNEEIAAVATYVRGQWGGRFAQAPILPADVEAARGQ